MPWMPRPENQPSEPARPFAPAAPVVLGLVGGVASGKSTVAGLFAARGVQHIDADAHARAATDDPDVLAEVRVRIGERYVVENRLDRQAVADLVFADADAKQALEAIVHPVVRARILTELRAAAEQGRSSLLDVPLLFEAGLFEHCDRIVFVAAPEEARTSRAAARGWAPGELARREQNQLPLEEKRQRAHATIDNSGTIGATKEAVDDLLRALETER